MLHYQYETLAIFIEHMQSYSTSSVPLVIRRGGTSVSSTAFVVNTLLNPLATFFYNYFVRGGFLDGREGLLFHLNHSFYVSWKYAKAWMAVKSLPTVSRGTMPQNDLPPDAPFSDESSPALPARRE